MVCAECRQRDGFIGCLSVLAASVHKSTRFTAFSQTGTRTRCQRRASSALVAETAVRTFGVIGVLGPVRSAVRVTGGARSFRVYHFSDRAPQGNGSRQLELQTELPCAWRSVVSMRSSKARHDEKRGELGLCQTSRRALARNPGVRARKSQKGVR